MMNSVSVKSSAITSVKHIFSLKQQLSESYLSAQIRTDMLNEKILEQSSLKRSYSVRIFIYNPNSM